MAEFLFLGYLIVSTYSMFTYDVDHLSYITCLTKQCSISIQLENYANVYKSPRHAFICIAVVKTQKKSCQLTSHLSALTGYTSSCFTKSSTQEGVITNKIHTSKNYVGNLYCAHVG